MATLMVLGGGGALGAYQAGCLVALAEQGVLPDALFGCSAGALNADFLAQGPSLARTEELANWWRADTSRSLLAPSLRARLRSVASSARTGGASLLDASALRRVVTTHVSCHDLSELAVPLTVTTTCLDCAAAAHHSTGPVADTLVASCALPGLLPPVRLPDGHLHVDGGIVCGVPLDAAMAVASPGDRVLVLDCGLAPVTSGPGCAALAGRSSGVGQGCGLDSLEPRSYLAPVDRVPRALDPVLRAFTAARAVASTATVRPFLGDPRVQVLPHVADAYAAGLLADVPRGSRDLTRAADLVRRRSSRDAGVAVHSPESPIAG
jgi:predicted acylesterase/phospholipase RssA